MNFKLYFHYISYLQYPLMLIALFYSFRPILFDSELDLKNVNSMLVFAGLAVSFSTLQDTSRTQNKISRRIWESPKKGRIFLAYLGILNLFLIVYGVYGFLSNKEDGILTEISFGIIVLGIGMIGMLKSGIEKFEKHRKDKNTNVNNI
ncbi:hypothetical protein GTQ40_07265 [Flavobacteriaceae bacterium R38]|nr:hypothetical protein [Flavobacteriaceae bacterium R38]